MAQGGMQSRERATRLPAPLTREAIAPRARYRRVPEAETVPDLSAKPPRRPISQGNSACNRWPEYGCGEILWPANLRTENEGISRPEAAFRTSFTEMRQAG